MEEFAFYWSRPMSDTTAARLLQEADFIDRYTQYYRRQLTAAMQQMKPEADGVRCIRMCMEALDMMRCSKMTLVEALAQSTSAK
jgi:hypothetical protein